MGTTPAAARRAAFKKAFALLRSKATNAVSEEGLN